VYLVGIGQRRQERVVGSQLAGLVVPYAQELRDLGVDEARLRELAELTGGGTLGQPRIAIDVWPWLVGLVAVMMVPEIALRRLGAGAWQRIIPARWRRDPERG